ncbi:MAG: hypothetical protein JJU15_20175, partial [Pararhodobacter sp.]|nr:hypothetical protein [Pararhodobacter sp.]
MAAKRRHWQEKKGRFWARIAIPAALQPYFDGKTQLTEPLGGDLRTADQKHSGAVARLQEKITEARGALEPSSAVSEAEAPRRPITPADHGHAVWSHYTNVLQADERKRASMPTRDQQQAEYEKLMLRIDSGEVGIHLGPAGLINAHTVYELMLRARDDDSRIRSRRLTALRSALAAGDFRLCEPAVQQFIAANALAVKPDAPAWQDLARAMARAEIDALERTLERTLERDRGDFSGRPRDPIVTTPTVPSPGANPVPMRKLFSDYIASRRAIGKHRDGGANWEHAISDLIKFLGHADASMITKRNLLDWRVALMASGKAAKTVSDKYLAAIRAVLRWAHENERLPTNAAASVKQDVPRKVLTRERGYTTPEAIRLLKASLAYQPAEAANPSNRESAQITAAKRWIPLLCAFTGARTTELTQLRKEDLRCEDGRWILRITPEAGSVKTGQYRDVPLRHQVVALGFPDFVSVNGRVKVGQRAAQDVATFGRSRLPHERAPASGRPRLSQ